jgi:hypothetical protein
MFKYNSIRQIALSTTATSLVLVFAFIALEPLVAHAVSDDVVVTQAVTAGISITDGAAITMTALSTSQNTAVGTSAWTVSTNNATGYTLSVAASTTAALKDGSKEFADYTPAVAATPETWSVNSAYEFGFSARGTDVTTGTWGTDADCVNATNVPSSTLKWRGFDGATGITVASNSSTTSTTGTATSLCVATEQNGIYAPSGSYTATITGTAITNP